MTMYCNINDVKDRLLIDVTDTSYDNALNNAINEASVVCDMFLRAYTNVPLTSPYPDEVRYACADIAASIFKRRMMPEDVTLRGALQPDQLNQMDATGWFALGIRKLEQFIKSKFGIQDKPLQNTIYNPELYIELFNRGLITIAEVRQFIVNPDVKIVEHKETYQYSRQKKFKVIRGKTDSDGYEVVSNE
jgi:phage gp36-like protein